jgi:hypothetical protein
VQQHVRHAGLGQQFEGPVQGVTFAEGTEVEFHTGAIKGHREFRGIETDPVPTRYVAGLTNDLR